MVKKTFRHAHAIEVKKRKGEQLDHERETRVEPDWIMQNKWGRGGSVMRACRKKGTLLLFQKRKERGVSAKRGLFGSRGPGGEEKGADIPRSLNSQKLSAMGGERGRRAREGRAGI